MKKLLTIAVNLLIILLSHNNSYAQVQVKDINPGIGSSDPNLFYQFNGKFLFCADNGFNGPQVYISDGTSSGTTMLTTIPNTIYPFEVVAEWGNTSGGSFFYYNTKYYFLVNRNPSGTASVNFSLWQTDGTVSGTFQIDTLPSSANYSSLFFATNSLGQGCICAFIATFPDSAIGGYGYNHLYKYNLTTSSSSLLYLQPNYGGEYYIDQVYANGCSPASNLTNVSKANGGIYNPTIGFANDNIGAYPYIYNNNLFVITPNTDSMFSMDIDGNLTFLYQFPFHVFDYHGLGAGGQGGHTFIGNEMIIYPDSTSETFGSEPHFYNFATNTGGLLEDINPYFNNSSDCIFFLPDFPNNYSKIYFSANDGVHGNELWVTDGTPAGTQLVEDICPGTCNGLGGFNYQYIGNNLYFDAWNGSATIIANTYVTSGTAISTIPIICSMCPGYEDSSILAHYGSTGSTAYYGWHDTTRNVDLFLTYYEAGSAGPTNWINSINNDTAYNLYNFNVFTCGIGVNDSDCNAVIKVGDALYFNYTDCNTGYELYTLSLSSGLGIGSVKNNTSVSIYPNPTTGEISVSGNTIPVIKVYNSIGQLVKEVDNNNSVSIAECPVGLYMILLYSQTGELLQENKIIKE